jgi:autotransporter passenger strand-loop-strand repeat protein
MVLDSGGSALVRSGGTVSAATIADGSLEIASGGLVASSTITFADPIGGTLILDDTRFRGKISGFVGSGVANSDRIDLTALSVFGATLAYTSNSLGGTLTVAEGGLTMKLSMLGTYAQNSFNITDDGHGHALITYGSSGGTGSPAGGL